MQRNHAPRKAAEAAKAAAAHAGNRRPSRLARHAASTQSATSGKEREVERCDRSRRQNDVRESRPAHAAPGRVEGEVGPRDAGECERVGPHLLAIVDGSRQDGENGRCAERGGGAREAAGAPEDKEHRRDRGGGARSRGAPLLPRRRARSPT